MPGYLERIIGIPETEDGLDTWAEWHHCDHLAIQFAIQQQIGTNLQVYQLDQITPETFQNWLDKHQQAHDDMNNALAINGSDLSGVDFADRAQRTYWLQTNFLEHRQAHFSLRI